VTQAGDPQTQRVKCGPTGLVWFYGRWDSWEKDESMLAMAWVFSDDRLTAICAWPGVKVPLARHDVS